MAHRVYKIREIPRSVPVKTIALVVQDAGGRFLERHLMGENHCSNVIAEIAPEEAAHVVERLQVVVGSSGTRVGKIRLHELSDFSSKARRSQSSIIRVQIASPPSWSLEQEGAEVVLFTLLDKLLAQYPFLEVDDKCLWMWSSRPNGNSRSYEVFVDLGDKHVARSACNSWSPILDAFPLSVHGKTVYLHTLQPPQKPRLFAGRALPKTYRRSTPQVRRTALPPAPTPLPATSTRIPTLSAQPETTQPPPAAQRDCRQAWTTPDAVESAGSDLNSILSRLTSQFDIGPPSRDFALKGAAQVSQVPSLNVTVPTLGSGVASTASSGSIGSCAETVISPPCVPTGDWPEVPAVGGSFLFFCNAANPEGTCLDAFARQVKTDPPPFGDRSEGLLFASIH